MSIPQHRAHFPSDVFSLQYLCSQSLQKKDKGPGPSPETSSLSTENQTDQDWPTRKKRRPGQPENPPVVFLNMDQMEPSINTSQDKEPEEDPKTLKKVAQIQKSVKRCVSVMALLLVFVLGCALFYLLGVSWMDIVLFDFILGLQLFWRLFKNRKKVRVSKVYLLSKFIETVLLFVSSVSLERKKGVYLRQLEVKTGTGFGSFLHWLPNEIFANAYALFGGCCGKMHWKNGNERQGAFKLLQKRSNVVSKQEFHHFGTDIHYHTLFLGGSAASDWLAN